MAHRTRRLAPAALAAGVLLVLSACGSGNNDAITFMSGGGAYGEALKKAFLDPYAEESGVKIVEDPTLSYAKIGTQVKAKKVDTDLVPAEGYWSVQQCGKLLQPLDPKIVDLSRVDKSLVQDKCGAPLLTYSTAIYYNVKTFGDRVPQSCADFFDTKTYPGKRAVRSAALPNPLIECALIADGVKPDDLYPLDIDLAFKKIETISDDLVFWEAGSDSETLMARGEVDLIMAWNGRAYAAISAQDAQFAGGAGDAFLIYDALVVPRGVENPEAAMKLINFMLQPERQAALTKLIPYSPSVSGATLTGLPEGLHDFLPETNEKVAAATIVQDQRWWAEHLYEVIDRWQSTFVG